MELKILILSDLNWHLASKRILEDDIIDLLETQVPGVTEKFSAVRKYWKIILNEQPDLVLLGGDLTGDGSCGHGFHAAFYYLLCLLELSKIQTYFIKGDNDLDTYYAFIEDHSNSLSHISEISNKSIKFKGLKILGIPYKSTNSKKELRSWMSKYKDHYDIVLCHSELKRRTYLFNLKADVLITGHFDNKLCYIRDSIFVSLSNDSSVINYATIQTDGSKKMIRYNFINPTRKRRISYSESYQSLRNDNLNGIVLSDRVPIKIQEFESLDLPSSDYEKDKNALALALKFLRGSNYKDAINFLYAHKSGQKIKSKELYMLRNRFFTSKHKLSKSMLIDFLGTKANSI